MRIGMWDLGSTMPPFIPRVTELTAFEVHQLETEDEKGVASMHADIARAWGTMA